jgi:hypothetical protein
VVVELQLEHFGVRILNSDMLNELLLRLYTKACRIATVSFMTAVCLCTLRCTACSRMPLE